MADGDKAWHTVRMLVTVSMSSNNILKNSELLLKLIDLKITSKHTFLLFPTDLTQL